MSSALAGAFLPGACAGLPCRGPARDLFSRGGLPGGPAGAFPPRGAPPAEAFAAEAFAAGAFPAGASPAGTPWAGPCPAGGPSAAAWRGASPAGSPLAGGYAGGAPLALLGSPAAGGLGHSASAPSSAKFAFQPRVGKTNWRLLHSLDVDRVRREVDIETLEQLMDNIMLSHFGFDDLETVSADSIIKLVQLLQLSLELLCSMCSSSHKLLTGLMMEKVRNHGSALAQSAMACSEQPSVSPGSRQKLRCAYCPKCFVSWDYLQQHVLRRHPDALAGPGEAAA
ncbi:unnamed protein product, partial [Prorocentrum cordatum]